MLLGLKYLEKIHKALGASRPEIPRKDSFYDLYQKRGLILLLQDDAFEIGYTF